MGYDGEVLNRYLKNDEAVRQWLDGRTPSTEMVAHARKRSRELFPTLSFTGHEDSVVCITDRTTGNSDGRCRPYIDFLSNRLGIASGGNGWAAKSADHIGWLACEMMANDSQWASDE